MRPYWQWFSVPLIGILTVLFFVGMASALAFPQLPDLDALTHYQPKQPLRVYSEDGYLIAEFGEERRAYTPIKQIPKLMQEAIIAIEDRRFYEHRGVDARGILRALVVNLSGTGKEGASTITMQVAKNFFSHGERGLRTKLYEAFLALKIEKNLSKEKILELYVNQIYLGQRAFGFAAASQVYFGKPLNKLNLAEIAMLAGLPKAPSAYNPFANLPRAVSRQKEVLHDMYRAKFIDKATWENALKQPLRLKASRQSRDLPADYVAEMVRERLYAQYQDQIYTSGLKVYTTILRDNQLAANQAIREGVLRYDLRHGYRGAEQSLSLNDLNEEDKNHAITNALDEIETINALIPAVVVDVTAQTIVIQTKVGERISLKLADMLWLQTPLAKKSANKPKLQSVLKIGDVIRVTQTENGWQVAQLPQVEAGLIALDSNTGAVRALVGGFSFERNKFNHVTQGWRQPGSGIKPFIYSAALEKGYTPFTILPDEPLTLSAGNGQLWQPQNYDNDFSGPVRLRYALAKSINIVAIRLLQAIGVDYARDYLTRFGFSSERHPPYLTIALGAGSATPWQMASAYAVFANGGYRIKANLINKVVDQYGKTIFLAQLDGIGNGSPRVIDARNAFIMTDLLRDVIRYGTATKAHQLARDDLAGKTGTTNDNVDAWFSGFHPQHVAVTWFGFDKPRSLGSGETGGHAALPVWIDYMRVALRSLPHGDNIAPEGIQMVRVNPVTGEADANGLVDYTYSSHEVPVESEQTATTSTDDPLEQLLKADLLSNSETTKNPLTNE